MQGFTVDGKADGFSALFHLAAHSAAFDLNEHSSDQIRVAVLAIARFIQVDVPVGDRRLVVHGDLVVEVRADRQDVRHRGYGQTFDVQHLAIVTHERPNRSQQLPVISPPNQSRKFFPENLTTCAMLRLTL
ncbi:hypothetical protein RU06_14725 [Curtobacterium flaccumfaciens]|nr:hypothetical protein RU06_14725 [Curtobacterium flaccumfaciens]